MNLPPPPSQDAWATALVASWNRYGSLVGAMLQACPVDGPMTGSDWDRYAELFGSVRPSVNPRSMLKQGVRAWLASHAKYASDALWDGRPDVAVKLMTKGGSLMAKNSPPSMIKKEDKKDNRITIYVRARDKRHEWKTGKRSPPRPLLPLWARPSPRRR